MSNWTWKQAVADEVLKMVNETRNVCFALDDIYAKEGALQNRFPNNRHVRDKIRQVLQQLRDTGLVNFLGGGEYELDLDYGDLALEHSSRDEDGIQIPKTSRVVRHVRLRNTLLASDLKQRYEYTCQVCQDSIQLVNRKYAEAHHIRPLGAPHLGRDVEGNILVLCPNHHVMLDKGAILINPKSLRVEHIHRAFEPRHLYMASWHILHGPSLEYYNRHIYGN